MNRTAPAATIATLLLVVLCGSPREGWAADALFMPFIGGFGVYGEIIADVAASGYKGFALIRG